ncbi:MULTISPECIES: ABC transporter substrate-binding protein [unclassified Agarivorans]|uniref:ABC transporter substrate-binding protein n=1 Tax=unclassified Agarivorans TaxID=2636026 RepID=UPI0026E46055|nr:MULTISPECIES: ABC transporter substrate-binding protein [unclassified Agarivorans]MDO6686954.1 ABC transporter substrate-binding protein [Agarivorans sp. 3_MG-2023]MDO6716751.1 ABC transporter substrate-binding protein [Agarivorans sp. 2_MG-2023]
MRLIIVLVTALLSMVSHAASTWSEVEQQAKGQTVYFNAWAGADNINAYIRWAGEQVEQRYGVKLEHVKINDTANVVSRILAEKVSGRTNGGSVDLMWVNGENFRALKEAKLLYGPYSQHLPNMALTEENNPALLYDFTLPVEGYESPWGGAQLTFYHDSKRLPQAPRSMAKLLSYLEKQPGLFTYPAPPSFYGATFIKQALLETITDSEQLYQPVNKQTFDKVTAGLWAYLDKLHPLMWRRGQSFPSGSGQMQQLLNDGELSIAFSFNPNDPAAAIEQGLLPDSVRSYVHQSGTVGNTHFLAIPFNSDSSAAAMVVANFMLSPEAQARKADLAYWGDPTVLALDKLSNEQQQLFAKQQGNSASLSAADRANVRGEPHATWVALLEAEWLRRYSR